MSFMPRSFHDFLTDMLAPFKQTKAFIHMISTPVNENAQLDKAVPWSWNPFVGAPRCGVDLSAELLLLYPVELGLAPACSRRG